jgi:hypothetical protein
MKKHPAMKNHPKQLIQLLFFQFYFQTQAFHSKLLIEFALPLSLMVFTDEFILLFI